MSLLNRGFSTITIPEIREEIKGVMERKSRELPGSFKGHPHISDEQIDHFLELWRNDPNYRLVMAGPYSFFGDSAFCNHFAILFATDLLVACFFLCYYWGGSSGG